MTVNIPIAIAAVSLLISLLALIFNKQKESKTDIQNNARIEAQLDHIGKGVDSIRIDLKANEKQTAALSERVTRVEESAKQAHKRLDNIEQKESV